MSLIFISYLASVLGYVFVRLGCEDAPFLLRLVLGPMLLSHGDPMVFVERPISVGLLITTALLLMEAFQEGG